MGGFNFEIYVYLNEDCLTGSISVLNIGGPNYIYVGAWNWIELIKILQSERLFTLRSDQNLNWLGTPFSTGYRYPHHSNCDERRSARWHNLTLQINRAKVGVQVQAHPRGAQEIQNRRLRLLARAQIIS